MTSQPADELKPCPFCGHAPHYWGPKAPWMVACDNDACPCQASSDFVGAWNTRPVEDDLRAKLAEANAIADDAQTSLSGLEYWCEVAKNEHQKVVAERDWLRAVLENVGSATRWDAEREARDQGHQDSAAS